MQEKNLNIEATNNFLSACYNTELVIIAVPTDYDSKSNFFDTSILDGVLEQINKLPYKTKKIPVVIKSTIPVGYTQKSREKYAENKYIEIIFSPEFLRESRALYDNLHPSRIIVGTNKKGDNCFALSKKFAIMLKEAEAVKLFSNTYLAMRVSYFNELDTYAELNNLDAKKYNRGCELRAAHRRFL